MTTSNLAERKVLTVSQLNRSAKNLLETYLPMLWVEGEVSNLSQPSSGHWYFTLKDNKAQVRCAMFRNRNVGVKVRPTPGDKIVVRGAVSLYEGRGDYQLIAEHMEPAGRGNLQQQFEQLKNSLQAQGLFASDAKKPLPSWPATVAVVTSATGAAVQDILTVLRRRAPYIAVKILPVAVQGSGAAAEIAEAINTANRHSLCDTLIVGRGGGSLEDLWAFNEEIVARAIHRSKIPVVSAVGHEVDFSISDFVADVRAATPSAAAELSSPNQQEALNALAETSRRLDHLMQQKISAARYRLDALKNALKHPGDRLRAQSQTLDQLELRLVAAMEKTLTQSRTSLQAATLGLDAQSPKFKIQSAQAALTGLSQRLNSSTQHILKAQQQRLQHAAGLLQSISPLNTLQRGYAIVFDNRGNTLASAHATKEGDKIKTRLADGEITSLVTEVAAN